MDKGLSWLFLEGLVPLLGAAALFLLWGCFRFVTTQDKAKFSYSWTEALDPFGWLYGAAILSMQSGFASTPMSVVLRVFCFVASGASLLLLISAMTDRGADSNWKPPFSLQLVSVVLVVAVLIAGYNVHFTDSPQNSKNASPAAQKQEK